MKREEILAKWESLKPRERDAWVAEVVFKDTNVFNVAEHWFCGHGMFTLPLYTEGVSEAWEIAEQYPIATVERVEIFEGNIEVKATLWEGFDYREPVEATAKTVPEAICKAALLAVLEEGETT
ncbi:hypothetical protein J28TS4_04920 [Paenibacillus lautus]|uniref:BC1872 family protein n=1 Tax=Paenibacillus lautus TaxID=1401 RepID=UPI001B14B792|nr:hypothetical protein [Paenibacillus lautus]GIP02085.1 hypothetical protein J28TS4_04920 [Paenibacillus lautus]